MWIKEEKNEKKEKKDYQIVYFCSRYCMWVKSTQKPDNDTGFCSRKNALPSAHDLTVSVTLILNIFNVQKYFVKIVTKKKARRGAWTHSLEMTSE